MSINFKLLVAGCLLAAAALTTATLSHLLQADVRQTTWSYFTRAVDPLVEVQFAQGRVEVLEQGFLAVSDPAGTASGALLPDQAAELVAGLTETLERLGEAGIGLTPNSASATSLEMLRYSVSRLKATQGEASRRLVLRELGAIGDNFERVVRDLRADAFAYRQMASSGLSSSMRAQILGTAGLVVLSAILLLWISFSIASAIRHSSASLAALVPGVPHGQAAGRASFGQLRRMIERTRQELETQRKETKDALAKRTELFEHELARQRDRFEAAIENMGRGFCMLDEKRNVVAANSPFSRMFSHLKPGASAQDLKADPHLGPLFGPSAEKMVVRETSNGEAIEIRRYGAGGGGTIITVENVTERRAASRRIEELSGCDNLTGLPNRDRFLERLEAAVKRAGPRDALAALFVEVEGFKAVNASLGHSAGDALLRVSAERLADAIGENDFLARIGGDEFAILGVSPGANAEELARRILAAFAEPVSAGARLIEAQIAVGIVPMQPRGAASREPQSVMQDGEVVLAHIRREGKGGVCVFTPAMRQAVDERRQLEADLKKAFREGQLELFYQPFVDTGRGRVSGFEALMRWRHPERGMVPPSVFIPLAEELELIDEMGRWALRSACRQAAGWPQDVIVSVNLSPSQLRSDALCDEVAAVLRETGLAPHRLQLEVTETLFLGDAERTLAILSTLRSLGLTISMDDFGTGYSSLGYLSRFPFDKIKIDQSFVRDMAKAENVAIVRAVIGLSAAMGMDVIAEGVETADQYARLRAEGCREMQGYLFSRPRPASELPRMIVEIGERFEGERREEDESQAVA